MFAFAGPAYLVSVGYMDPGNWATDLEGGARFGYQLLWVLVMSNLMAILLQTLSARLGIVSGRDLAQACRESYPRVVTWALWMLCEVAIAACDLAEVLGAAIGFNLLFGMPLLAGVAITATDTVLLLFLQGLGIRTLEAFVLSLITVIGGCFLVEILLAKPAAGEVLTGLVPRLNRDSLYVAIGILGATVMPHNLYLHSALVQTRTHRPDREGQARRLPLQPGGFGRALNGAMLVNAAILVLAATVFFKRGIVVTEIQQAHLLLEPLLGTTLAGVMFAVALLCAGQSSTLTGTMAGQIVMEGFLNFRMRPWLRRLITRMLAIIPAAITIYVAGEKGTYQLLDLQPGGAEHAIAVRGDSADPVHQRQAAHGQFRQCGVVALARLGYRRRNCCAEYPAGGGGRIGLARCRRRLEAAGLGGGGIGRHCAHSAAGLGYAGAGHRPLGTALRRVARFAPAGYRRRVRHPGLPPHSGTARPHRARPAGAGPCRRPRPARTVPRFIWCTWRKA